MTSHCFPFRQIPHSTRLFLDYLDHTSQARKFYPRSPRLLEWAQDESRTVEYPRPRRERIADILERQNKTFGASAQTQKSISLFREGALALVTGQQVGLFGGPAFSLYKALSAVKLAAAARETGLNCVPVFWLATEDHDLEEVNQVRIPGPDAKLERMSSMARSADDRPVASVKFGAEISETVQQAQALLGASETGQWLSECYQPGETFGTAFAKLFARLFGEFGVILLDGSDPELDRIAGPLYRQVAEDAGELNRALLERDQQLQAGGYHQQVHITHSTTPLFLMREGLRVPLHLGQDDQFLAGERTLSRGELLEIADSRPELFSPNVLLRPVVQDYLLPTLAYVGGSAEVAYFAQAAVLYQALHGRITPVLPRFSATLIEAKPHGLLERYKLAFSDLFQGTEALREKIGAHLLDPNLQGSFDGAEAAVRRSMTAVSDALTQLDKTLVESATHAEAKMLYQLTNLRSRAARAELRQSEVAERHARFLSHAIYPEKVLQEREFAGAYFLAKYGRELLGQLLELIHPDCVDHQVITL